MITVLFLLLGTLDRPFHDGVGGLEPVAMERSQDMIDQALAAIDGRVVIPCDANGARVAS